MIAGLRAHWLWRAAPGHRWNGVLLRGRIGGEHRNSAVGWSSDERINADSCVHSRTREPDCNPTGVAICPSVVAVLHSERNYSQAATRWHCEKLREDHGRSSPVAAFGFRVGRGIVLHR